MTYILLEMSIPLLSGLLLLLKPQIFTKEDLNAVENLKIKKKFSNIGKVLLLASLLIGLANVGTLHQKEKINTSELIRQIVLKGNEQFPKAIDEFTTLEYLSSKDNTIVYHYTLKGLDLSSTSKEKFIQDIKPNLIKIAKEKPQIQAFRDRNISFEHIYKDKNSSFKVTILVGPGEY